MNPETIATLLEHVLILRELHSDALATLAHALPLETFKAGEVIFHQGASPDALYILI
ncbi:MAG: cyclic nucleotide-binding domain-containing protein, partial [Anaerolineales bacterium]